MSCHLWHSSTRLGSAQLGTLCHPGRHSSAQLGSTQLSSVQLSLTRYVLAQLSLASFGLAQLGSVPMPGRASRREAAVHSAPLGRRAGPLPAARARTSATSARIPWNKGSTGQSLPPGPPLHWGLPSQGGAPRTCSSAGGAPHGRWATCHPGPEALASHAWVSPGAWSRQVRCESLPSCSLRCGANNPWVIPNHFSAPHSLFATGSRQHPATRLPSVIVGLQHANRAGMSAPGLPRRVPRGSREALPCRAGRQVHATSSERWQELPALPLPGGQSPLLSRFITQGNCCRWAHFIKHLL